MLAGILLLLSILVALGIEAGFTSLRIYRDMQSAKASLFSALGELRARNLEPASGFFAAAEEQLNQARSEFGKHKISIGAAKAVPFVATQIEAMENFIDIGSCLVQAGDRLCETAAGLPGLDPNAPPDSLSIGQMVDLLDRFQTDLGPIDESLSAASAMSSVMNDEWLVSPAAKAKQELDEKLDSASRDIESARELITAFAGIMGKPGDPPKRYMIILQDSYELRGSGGVISTYGILECTHETFNIVQCERAGNIPWGVNLGEAMPQPLTAFFPELHLWDAGWWPDFPTTTALIDQILAANRRDKVSGYIAVDPIAIQYALEKLGPLELPEYNEEITSENLAEKILFYLEANSNSSGNKTAFLQSLANSFLERITSAAPAEWFVLGQALNRALAERHLLLWFQDPIVQQTFSARDWSGQMENVDSDYLMAVDCNIGGNDVGYKSNFIIRPSMRLEISREPDKGLRHHVTYYFDNTQGLTEYYSYLRVFVPQTSLPVENGGQQDLGEELGKRVLAQDIKVPAGELVAVDFDYLTTDYDAILIQQQPGQQILPVQVLTRIGKAAEEQSILLINQTTLKLE